MAAYELEPMHVEQFPLLAASLGKLLGVDASKFSTSFQKPSGLDSPLVTVYEERQCSYDPAETKKYPLAQWQIMGLPGCCGIALSYHASVGTRSQGVGRLLQRWRRFLAVRMDYGYMQATTRVDWEHGRALLESEGFQEVKRFVSVRTRHELVVYLRELDAQKDGVWDGQVEDIIKRRVSKEARVSNGAVNG